MRTGDVTGIELIAAERNRQITEEVWTPEHDDTHDMGEMASAAACYALSDCTSTVHEDVVDANWPWDWKWWKPKDRVSDLVRAGALIAAEIDRLKRAAKDTTEPQSPHMIERID